MIQIVRKFSGSNPQLRGWRTRCWCSRLVVCGARRGCAVGCLDNVGLLLTLDASGSMLVDEMIEMMFCHLHKRARDLGRVEL